MVGQCGLAKITFLAESVSRWFQDVVEELMDDEALPSIFFISFFDAWTRQSQNVFLKIY